MYKHAETIESVSQNRQARKCWQAFSGSVRLMQFFLDLFADPAEQERKDRAPGERFGLLKGLKQATKVHTSRAV